MQRSLSHHICCDSGHCFLRARPNVRLKVVSLYKQGVLRTSNTRIRSYMYTQLKLYDIPFIMTQKSYRTYSLKISAKFLTSTCTRTILWLNVNVLYKFVTSWVTCTVRIRVKIGPQNLPPLPSSGCWRRLNGSFLWVRPCKPMSLVTAPLSAQRPHALNILHPLPCNEGVPICVNYSRAGRKIIYNQSWVLKAWLNTFWVFCFENEFLLQPRDWNTLLKVPGCWLLFVEL